MIATQKLPPAKADNWESPPPPRVYIVEYEGTVWLVERKRWLEMVEAFKHEDVDPHDYGTEIATDARLVNLTDCERITDLPR